MIDYEKELNDQQLAAVRAPTGPVLVIAGAGSGKTRTLTYRVAYLMENGVPSDRILLLTFTNKAAKEMLYRVGNLMPFDASRIWGGTFHSVANRILRRHANLLGYDANYVILDREDSKDLVQACIPEAGINIKEKRFPKADVLIEIFGLTANTGRSVADIVETQYPHFSEEVSKMERVQKLYDQRKKTVNGMDYDDLLVNFLRLMREYPEAAEVYRQRFLSILVDEYQDTNRIQSDIVDCLAVKHRNVMVVGDDAQSIYSWRRANFRNIMEFPKRYPQTLIFKIEHNYRSTPQILAFANVAISVNIHQFKKELQAIREDGPKPQVVPVACASEQASFVASQMLELRDQGMDLRDMAVLYRSHFHSMELQMEMTRRNIPFQITSGLRFFEQAHVKDVAAYLKLATNPQDELSFKRIVLTMPKVGNATASKLWKKMWEKDSESKLKVKESRSDSKPDMLENGIKDKTESEIDSVSCRDYLEILEAVPRPAQKAWTQFAETLKQLRETGVVDCPSKMIQLVLDAGYEDELKIRFENYASRKEDLIQLRDFSEKFDNTHAFLAELALMTNVEVEGETIKSEKDRESARLSTVHQAKGQEFRVVFILWLTEGSFPNSRAMESPEGEEEERRLFYVAVTRAKDELYLLHPQMRFTGDFGDSFQRPSRFLQEIPSKWYEKREVESGYV